MEEKKEVKVGYTESEPNRKSITRLGVMVSVGICLFATAVEGTSKILSVVSANSTEVVEADWTAVATLVGVLLVGSGIIKAGQGVNRLADKSKTK